MQEINAKPSKVYKQSPEKRAYFRDKATENRIKTQRKCKVCGELAIVKTLDTHQKLCPRHAVPVVKEGLLKLKPKEEHEQK